MQYGHCRNYLRMKSSGTMREIINERPHILIKTEGERRRQKGSDSFIRKKGEPVAGSPLVPFSITCIFAGYGTLLIHYGGFSISLLAGNLNEESVVHKVLYRNQHAESYKGSRRQNRNQKSLVGTEEGNLH